jgi:dephospho-CoA kinase
MEHLGPTAVPGVDAEDVIDIRAVLSPRDDPDGIGPALREAGFVGGGVAEVGGGVESVFWSADPGRAARLHIREEAGAGR